MLRNWHQILLSQKFLILKLNVFPSPKDLNDCCRLCKVGNFGQKTLTTLIFLWLLIISNTGTAKKVKLAIKEIKFRTDHHN